VLRFVLRAKIIRLKYALRDDAVHSDRPRARLGAGPPPKGESSELMDDALATVLLLLNNIRPNHSTSPTKLMIELRRLTQQLIDLQLHTDALDFHSIALCKLEALAHHSPGQVAYDMPLALATQALLLGLSARNDDAREAIRRAIALAERLSDDNGKAITAICFNVMAWVDDYSLETATYLERAIAIYWHLMARYPSRYLVKYLESLSLLGHVMLNAGDPLRAIAVLNHAVLFGRHLDRPHHQPIRERILTRLNKALQSAGKNQTAGAVVPGAKYTETSGDGRGGVCRWTRRLLVCCRKRRTPIGSSGDAHSRFCRRISSVLDKIRAMRLANTTPPCDAHGVHASTQSMRHANAPFRSHGKSDPHYLPSPSIDHPPNKEGLKNPPFVIEDTPNLYETYDPGDSLHSERMVFLDSCWKEMERVFQERPRHINDRVHGETTKKLYVEELTSTVSWKTEGSSQILFAPTITHQFTLYTPVEATNDIGASVTDDYLMVFGLRDEPIVRSTPAFTIPERKRRPGWI